LQLNFFSSAAAFRSLSRLSRPCCLVLDLCVGDESGEDLQMDLTGAGLSIPIIFHTRDADFASAVRVMERGAMTVLQKPSSVERLTQYLEAGIEIDRNQLRLDQMYREIEKNLGELTVRQRWILDRMVDGMPSKKIARKLEVSKRTVETERSAILRTFKVQSTPDVTLQIGQFRILSEAHVGSERRRQVAERLCRRNSIPAAAQVTTH
jgi:FixJ family two-component response regulator